MARFVDMSHRSISNGLMTRLIRKRWKVLGTGYFGTAYGKGNLVWKMEAFRKDAPNGSGWRAYMRAIADGVFSGPLVPKVKMVVQFKDGFAALMERCEASVYSRTTGDVAGALRATLEGRIDDWINYGASARVRLTQQKKLLADHNIDPAVYQFRRILRAWSKREGFSLDCHGENMMFRRNGTLCITDPVSFKREQR